MTDSSSAKQSEFDSYAADYDSALEQGISVSGEDKTYFASGRIAWLASCLESLKEKPGTVLDFGCGTGTATPFLFEKLGVSRLVGVDLSRESVLRASQDHGSEQAVFMTLDQYIPNGEMDLVFCSGVFHHIPAASRLSALNYIYQSLRPGALFAFWENNPWNPGTRYVMSRIPFDRDAVKVSAREGRRLLSAAKFKILRTDFAFIFPRPLSWLRGLEPAVSRLPLGAQYQIMCRKE